MSVNLERLLPCQISSHSLIPCQTEQHTAPTTVNIMSSELPFSQLYNLDNYLHNHKYCIVTIKCTGNYSVQCTHTHTHTHTYRHTVLMAVFQVNLGFSQMGECPLTFLVSNPCILSRVAKVFMLFYTISPSLPQTSPHA